jgi:Xaa-Pro aminopeptidase
VSVAFSREEFAARWQRVRALMAENEVEALLAFGNRGAHHEVLYLSGFQVSGEAVLLVPMEADPVLLVHFLNHVPAARRMSVVADVRPRGDDAIGASVAALKERGVDRRVGVCGPLSFQRHRALCDALGERNVLDLSEPLTAMRVVKSEDEIAMTRVGAELSDRAIRALREHVRPGMTEFELVALIEGAYLPLGGQTHIHYVGVTSMADPSLCVPAQLPSDRRVQAGDAVIVELSAGWNGYYGQVLRTFAVASDPTEEYARMHEVAEQAFVSICGVIRPGASSEAVLDAAKCISSAGYTIYDDLVHCAVGGVYSPYLRTRETQPVGARPYEFLENMLIVVQPNVITRDERMGVQYGEMLVVRSDGVESLHGAPRGFLRCG